MTWCRQATSHYFDQCLAKFVCHYLGANELIYSQTVTEPTDFYLVVCMASNLIFRKQRYSSRRRSYIYPTWQCRIAISSTLVRGLCRQGYSFALATPGGACLAAVFCWSCRETVCYCGNRSIRPTVVQPRVLQPQIVQLRSIRPKCQVVQPHIP